MAGFIQGRLASGEDSAVKGALGYVIPQDWKLDAECARLDKDGKPLYDPDLWFNEKRPQGREAAKKGVLTNRQSIAKAMSICDTLCPVRAECWDAATYEDLRVSVRGGILPLKEPVRAASQVSELAKECRKGHDLTAPGARLATGRCRQCRRIRDTFRDRRVVDSQDDTTESSA